MTRIGIRTSTMLTGNADVRSGAGRSKRTSGGQPSGRCLL